MDKLWLSEFDIWDLEEVFTEEDEKYLTSEEEDEEGNELAGR